MNILRGRSDPDTVPLLPEDVAVTMPDLPARHVVNTPEGFKAISDPMRDRILSIIQNQPATAKQIADRLGATPGAIGYHLRVLEEAGLAQVVARRLVRGIVASYYTRTGKIFMFELPQELVAGESAALNIISKAHGEMVEALSTVNDELQSYDGFPHARLSPERVRYYHERLEALVDELVNEPFDPDGEVYGVLVAMFKSPPYMQGRPTTMPSESE